MFHVQRRRRQFIVFGFPKPSSKVLIWVLISLSFYYLPYIILRKWLRWFDEKHVISPRLLYYATVILAFHHCTGSQQSASRGRVLAFYRIAPGLRSFWLPGCSNIALFRTVPWLPSSPRVGQNTPSWELFSKKYHVLLLDYFSSSNMFFIRLFLANTWKKKSGITVLV